MNSIAVLVNDNNETSSWLESGTIKLFSMEYNEWNNTINIPYTISEDTNILILRKYLSELVEKLDNCRVFIAKEISGQLFSILESFCFSMYELEGPTEQLLDSVYISEKKFQAEEFLLKAQSENKYFPQKIDKFGNYTIDLKTLLQSDGTISSKQILIPFLKEETFESLEVICDHTPKWFDRELSSMGYNFHIATRKDGILSISIYPRKNSK